MFPQNPGSGDRYVAEAGRMDDFYDVAPTLARRHGRRVRLTFAAFDVLWVAGILTTSLPHEHRRRLLVDLELPPPAMIVPS